MDGHVGRWRRQERRRRGRRQESRVLHHAGALRIRACDQPKPGRARRVERRHHQRDRLGSDAGSGGGAGSGGSDGGSAGSGADDDGANGDGSNGSGGAGGGSGTATTLPAGTTLPNCTAGVVTLSLRSVQNVYSPDRTPTFQLIAKNSSGSDCKVDLGPKTAVLTITKAGADDDYWSSADCPKASGSLLYRVPAGDSFTYTLKWDRKPSAPECATPPAGTAGAGTYLVEAKAPGFAKAQTSFVLKDD